MKTLLSMVDFVEEIKDYVHESKNYDRAIDLIFEYSTFLKQPLTLGMFIPCDENGNVLEEPDYDGFEVDTNDSYFEGETDIEIEKYELKYQKAKEKVLFNGFEVKDDYALGVFEDQLIYIDEEYCQDINIEQFLNTIWSKIELTQSAINQIGL